MGVLEAAGVEFIDEHGNGLGVRPRQRVYPGVHHAGPLGGFIRFNVARIRERG